MFVVHDAGWPFVELPRGRGVKLWGSGLGRRGKAELGPVKSALAAA
jgi:hypothetical protein